MGRLAEPLRDHPHVGDVRQTGMVLAIEMVKDKSSLTPYDFRERRGLRVFRHAISRGVMLRPLGNVIYWMPPYVISDEELALVAEVTREGLEIATADA